jgi:DNA-binding GntR family transcriptional regulator
MRAPPVSACAIGSPTICASGCWPGEFAPGVRLLSDPDLARSLGVSRSSLRSGIALLEEDGLLRRRHRSGTYVTDKPLLHNDLSRNFSVLAMIAATGVKPGTVLGRHGSEPASAEVAVAFGIASGSSLSVLRRVRTADGRRVVDTTEHHLADAFEISVCGRGAGDAGEAGTGDDSQKARPG